MTEQTTIPTPVKTEFTEVFTVSDLMSVPSSPSPEFSTVITETSILEPTPPQQPIAGAQNLIELYDETFPTPETYRAFVDARLAPWKESLEMKYFNTLYMTQRHTTETIQNIRRQAQILLEEANKLQGRRRLQRQELDRHIATITKPEFRKQFFSP